MRIKPIIYGLCASLFFVSCTKETIDEQYVKLEQVACSFYSTGNQPLEIKVKANPSVWEAESNAAWLEVDKSEDGSMLILTVADNDSENERTTEVTVTAGEAMQKIRIIQLAFNGSINRYRPMPTHQLGSAISPSGRYAGGFESNLGEGEDADSYIYTPVIIDIQTGEEYRLGEIPQSLADFTQTMVITDEGLLFIEDAIGGAQWVFDKDGNYFSTATLSMPEGYSGAPHIQGTSADGRKWVGYAIKDDGMYHPLLWTDGQVHELQFPDENFRGEAFSNGIMARGISADGSVIYGTTWDAYDFGMVYWTDVNEKARYVGEDVREVQKVTIERPDGVQVEGHIVNGVICTANLLQVSPEGKWVAGSYRTETLAENNYDVTQSQYAAFYDTETGKTTVIEDYGESTGLRATDDGIAFIGAGSILLTSGYVYDLNTGSDLGSMTDWIYNNYGIHTPSGVINFINADGSVLFGTYPLTSGAGTQFQNYYIAPPLE